MEAILSAVPHEYVEPLGTMALPRLLGTTLRLCALAQAHEAPDDARGNPIGRVQLQGHKCLKHQGSMCTHGPPCRQNQG